MAVGQLHPLLLKKLPIDCMSILCIVCVLCSFRDIFHVMSKPDANNLAYTAGYLPLHTDLPYYRYQPGVRFSSSISS